MLMTTVKNRQMKLNFWATRLIITGLRQKMQTSLMLLLFLDLILVEELTTATQSLAVLMQNRSNLLDRAMEMF